jgi:hypothetical protein
MHQQESRIPFGLGRRGNTGGVGLSTFTITGASAPGRANQLGLAVAELLDAALNSGGTVVGDLNATVPPTPLNGAVALNAARNAIETVRLEALTIAGVPDAQSPGILPAYIELFGTRGLSGARVFGLKNT